MDIRDRSDEWIWQQAREYGDTEEYVDELWRRYQGMKALARGAVHGKGCACPDCRRGFDSNFG